MAWGVRAAGVMGTPGTAGSGARQGWEAAQGLSGGLCMSPWVLCHLMSPWVLCHLTCMHPSHRETLFICIRCSFHLVGNCSQHTKYVKRLISLLFKYCRFELMFLWLPVTGFFSLLKLRLFLVERKVVLFFSLYSLFPHLCGNKCVCFLKSGE